MSDHEMRRLLADRAPVLVPHHPQFVQTAEDQTRWELCVTLACALFEAEPESEDVNAAARALYGSGIPTGP